MIREHVSRALWTCWTPVARHAAKHYVAGDTLADAMRVCRRISQSGYRVTVCYWDSGTERPEDVADHYREALRDLRGFGASNPEPQPPNPQPQDPQPHVSVKAPALRYSVDLAATVIDECRRAGVRPHFDAHGPETADATFQLIDAIADRHCHIGCTLPGRWTRSLRDAQRAVDRGLSVRVVKGQWADPDAPERDPRRGFLEVVDRLAGRARHVGVASHDARLARAAIDRLRAAGTSCELELLFGLPTSAVLRAVKDLSVPVRMYVPYGHAWLPYCLSQLKTNPRMLCRVFHDLVVVRVPAHP